MCTLQVTNIWNGSQMVSAFRVRSFPFNLDYGLWPLNIVNDDEDIATFSPAESGMGEILSIAVLNSLVKFNRTTNAKLFALNTLKFSVWTSRGRIGFCVHWGVDPTSHALKRDSCHST